MSILGGTDLRSGTAHPIATGSSVPLDSIFQQFTPVRRHFQSCDGFYPGDPPRRPTVVREEE